MEFNSTLLDEFKFIYKNYSSNYFFSLNWENKKLLFNQLDSEGFSDQNVVILPLNDDWQDFGDRMDEIGIFDWYGEYIMNCADGCEEGDEWELLLKLNGLEIESRGSNSYPGTFREFIKAIENLTGVLVEGFHQD